MVEVSNTIACKSRSTTGKGWAHKLRAQGMIPAIAYGPQGEPRQLTLDPYLFGLQRSRFGVSYIYDVAVEGGDTFKALIKDVQIDPLSRAIVHVDLYAVDMSKPIRVEVPIELVGKPAGAIDGGLLSQVLRRVEVQCLPNLVPGKLTVDVSPLTIGQVVHTDSIELPDGVEIVTRRVEAVATVTAPEAEEVVAAPAEGEPLAEGEAPAEGEAAAAGEEGAAKPEEPKKD